MKKNSKDHQKTIPRNLNSIPNIKNASDYNP